MSAHKDVLAGFPARQAMRPGLTCWGYRRNRVFCCRVGRPRRSGCEGSDERTKGG